MITTLIDLDNIFFNSKINFDNSKSYTLKKEKDDLVFKAKAVGLKEKDITMSLEDKYLNIKSNKENNETLVNNIGYSVYVGNDILKDKTSASLKDGLLTVKMPMIEEKKSYKINF